MASQEAQDQALIELLLEPLEGRNAQLASALLIERHGTLPAVLAYAREVKHPDRCLAHLAVVDAVIRAAALGRLARQPKISTADAAIEHLMLEMAALPVEHVRVLFLNARNRLLASEVVARGTIDSAPAYPREIIRRALELGAASLVLAHNHPSGDATPSRQDRALTQQIIAGGNALGIAIFDHLVLASSGWTSMRAQGFL